MTIQNYSKVAVLLATYNGSLWLPEQVDSILSQISVEVFLFVSDDRSIDDTFSYLSHLAELNPHIKILPGKVKFGSSGKNFYRLIQDVDISGFDFIAFADQDDIWEPDKLIHHIKLAREHLADGVSSNVIAFWSNGKEKLIIKSESQKKLDFLFESAGPGCTYLMTPWLVYKLREQLQNKYSLANEVASHDWLTYAVCRAYGHKWIIDSRPSVRYRQHQSNAIGANSGFIAKLARLKKIKQGWYRAEVIKICQVTALISGNSKIKKIGSLLTIKNFSSQIGLISYIGLLRRNVFDRFVLSCLIIFFVF
jgi:rhamnosyltransferase